LLLLYAGAAGANGAPANPGQQGLQGEQGQSAADGRAAGGERVANDDGTEDGATLLLTPSRLEVAAGSTVRLSLSVLGAEDLRRMPATVYFDAGVLELVDVHLGSAWKDGPRPLLLHDASRPGEVVIGLGLLDRRLHGVSGSVELLELEFRAVDRGIATLRLEHFAVIGAASRAQPSSALAAEILVR
jgi:hypothetical protein